MDEGKNVQFSGSDLTDEEMQRLLVAIQESPGFTGYRIEELCGHNAGGKVVVLRLNGSLCGLVAYRFFGKNWAEITTLIVLPEFRGHGYGKLLWQRALENLADKNLFAMAINSLVKKKFALKTGFVKKSFLQLPLVVQTFLIFQRVKLYKILQLLGKRNVKLKDLEFFVMY